MTPTPPQAGERAEGLDSLRLDFLEANPRAVWRSAGYREHGDSWSYRNVHGCAKDTGSLRTAIDAAIAALDSEESK